MNHLNRFNESKGLGGLKESEMKLLFLLLKNLEDMRSDMTCNDPERREERLFSRRERKEMLSYLSDKGEISKEDADEMDGYMYNNWYAAYLMYKIKDLL